MKYREAQRTEVAGPLDVCTIEDVTVVTDTVGMNSTELTALSAPAAVQATLAWIDAENLKITDIVAAVVGYHVYTDVAGYFWVLRDGTISAESWTPTW